MLSPRDSVEEDERILGLWTVLTLDKVWAGPHPSTVHKFLAGVPTPDHGVSSRVIETKAAMLWERVNDFAARVRFSPPSHGRPTSLTVAFNHTPQIMHCNKTNAFLQEFINLSTLLDAVVGNPPSLDSQAIVKVENPEHARRLCVAYTILNAATVCLHAPFAFSARSETSKHKRLTAARPVLHTS